MTDPSDPTRHHLDDLYARIDTPLLPEGVSLGLAGGGLPRLTITTPAAEAHVYLHGAHVTHYQPRGQAPVLFMSDKSHFEPGKPIRGGVPVIFPWFGPSAADPSAPAHGYARTQPWALRDARRNDADGSVTVSLSLGPTDLSRRWPAYAFDFELLCTVTVGPSLDVALEVRNTSSEPFTYEEALHTYLAVTDVRQIVLTGLAGRQYLDKMQQMWRFTQSDALLTFTAETDRVYLDTPDTVTVTDPAGARRLVVSKEGSGATVVWNPWVAKAKAMPDFGDDEWPAMVCVETANAADHAVTLQPGGRHVMRAVIRSERLSG